MIPPKYEKFSFGSNTSNTQKYVSFGAFLVFAGTGIAIAYTGCTLLLEYVAYLSPWIPTWVWLAAIAIIVLGIFITAVGTSGAIGTMAEKTLLRNMCMMLVLGVIFLESSSQVAIWYKGKIFATSLHNYMKIQMTNSQLGYNESLSDTQMWDEIQWEMNCCGVNKYSDWYITEYGNGSNVPDTCCLEVSHGCGIDIASKKDIDDEIVTQGCLPSILSLMCTNLHVLAKTVWLPTVLIQIVLAFVLIYGFVGESWRSMYETPSKLSVIPPAPGYKKLPPTFA